jgi:hypothetical protein
MTLPSPHLAMPERDLENHVRAICKSLGVVYIHHGRSVQVIKGELDDLLIGPRGILFRELKKTTGTVTAEQAAMIAVLREAGADVAVWRPADLLSERIAYEIAAIARIGNRIRRPRWTEQLKPTERRP